MFCAAEDEHGSFFLREEFFQKGSLLIFVQDVNLLSHALSSGSGWSDLYARWRLHVLLCHLHDGGRHRCREEHGLTLFWNGIHDLVELWRKSHVEHAIGFVEHKHLHFRKGNGFLLHVIDKASWGRNNDMRLVLQHVFLAAHRGASNQNGRPKPEACGKLLISFFYLNREFASRQKNKPASFMDTERLNHWKSKRKRFSCSCLGDANDIVSLEGNRNRAHLDGGRFRDAKLCKGCDKFRGDTKGCEARSGFGRSMHNGRRIPLYSGNVNNLRAKSLRPGYSKGFCMFLSYAAALCGSRKPLLNPPL